MRSPWLLALSSAAVALVLGGCSNGPHQAPVASGTPRNEPIQPIAAAAITDTAKVALGRQLYFDPRLSRSGFISCNSCHNLSMGGTDNLPTSIGHKWHQGPINAPTVLNATFNVAQFWDGRARDLKEQAGGPIANPGEMGSTHELAVQVLRSMPQYVAEFKAVYHDDSLTVDRATDAIAAFEATLVTPDSRFDRWLRGDDAAINADEKSGYALFKSAGCVACHNGAAVGGGSFQKLGVVAPFATTNPAVGRMAVTHDPGDRMKFKVPTLRNVELTYPYFHDGSAATLEQAVTTMGHVQLGRDFSKVETDQIVAFLRTLTGKQPEFALPQLPPSTAETPRPVPFGG